MLYWPCWKTTPKCLAKNIKSRKKKKKLWLLNIWILFFLRLRLLLSLTPNPSSISSAFTNFYLNFGFIFYSLCSSILTGRLGTLQRLCWGSKTESSVNDLCRMLSAVCGRRWLEMRSSTSGAHRQPMLTKRRRKKEKRKKTLLSLKKSFLHHKKYAVTQT